MEYNLNIDEEKVLVDALISEQKIEAKIGDDDYNISFSSISDNQIYLVVNGQGVNAYVCDTEDGKTIIIDGRAFFVQDADLLEQNSTRKKTALNKPSEVTPPMPAVVIVVSVKTGDRVESGQGVVVVSAMKMETTLFAPYAGIVKKINVNEGDKVMPGDILVDIEKEEETLAES